MKSIGNTRTRRDKMNILHDLVAFYDRNIVRLQGWKPVPGSNIGFLYLVPSVYKGKPVTISDGTVIKKGDKFFEIHIINTNLHKLNTHYGNLFVMLKDELIKVGELLEQEGYEDYKAVLGVTLLYQLAKRVGFTIFEIEPAWKRSMISFGENFLRSSLRKGKEERKDKKKRYAKECWISRDQIMNLKH